MEELRITQRNLEELWKGYNQVWQMTDGEDEVEARKALDSIEHTIEIVKIRINSMYGDVLKGLDEGKIITWTKWEYVDCTPRLYKKNLETGILEYSDDDITWKPSKMNVDKIKANEWRIVR